jgi:hypothetical protein
MEPNKIKLNNMSKQFEYEKHSREIDNLSHDDAKLFAQQETLSNISTNLS